METGCGKVDRLLGVDKGVVDENIILYTPGNVMERINNSTMFVTQKGLGDVVDGKIERRYVKVKRSHSASKENLNNVKMLTKYGDNTNSILPYYCSQIENSVMYSGVQRFLCTLEQLVGFDSQNKREEYFADWESEVRRYVYDKVDFLKNIVQGLADLHSKGVVHRDLHPENVVIVCKKNQLLAKIWDLSIACESDVAASANYESRLDQNRQGKSRDGWRAHEQYNYQNPETYQVDMYNFGILMFYCLTDGFHPYTDNMDHLYMVNFLPEASHLIRWLLQLSPYSRPSATQALNHPVFWTNDTKLSLLVEVGSNVKTWQRYNDPMNNVIMGITSAAIGGQTAHWFHRIDPHFLHQMRFGAKYKATYRDQDLRDLLRLIRNFIAHLDELSAYQVHLGGDIFAYFNKRFPNLFMEVYHAVYTNCQGNDLFKRFC